MKTPFFRTSLFSIFLFLILFFFSCNPFKKTKADFKKWDGLYRYEGFTFADPYEYDGLVYYHFYDLDSSGNFRYSTTHTSRELLLSDIEDSCANSGNFEILNDSTIDLHHFRRFRSEIRIQEVKSADEFSDVWIMAVAFENPRKLLRVEKLKAEVETRTQEQPEKFSSKEKSSSNGYFHFQCPKKNDVDRVTLTGNGYCQAYNFYQKYKTGSDYKICVLLAKDPDTYPDYKGPYFERTALLIKRKNNLINGDEVYTKMNRDSLWFYSNHPFNEEVP
ncbi:MAG: hypothetical protein IAF38_22630 [Bacteroidia bacterium]|nr:hypothetical protein [Bacteroidia bacterium]